MTKHLEALDRADLKTTGWITSPLDNVEHDFVSPLLDNYLQDLHNRIYDQEEKEAGFAKKLRKAVQVLDAEDLVNVQYAKISSLKDDSYKKEKELELDRRAKVHHKKVQILINEKVQFKKSKGFKRQNSYVAQLDEFTDMDDATALKKNMAGLRRSVDPTKKRKGMVVKVKDCVQFRLERDIFAQSLSDSVAATAFNQGGRRSNSNMKRRTADGFHRGPFGDGSNQQSPMLAPGQ